MKLLGLDHADIRVPSIAAVEAFYDALFPALGLSRKTESHVGSDGEWYDVGAERPRNVIEYHTPIAAGSAGWFVGVVEWSIDAGYPALFFEDPAGTRLEICARRPRA